MAIDFEQMQTDIKRILELISNISEGKSTLPEYMDIDEVVIYTRLSMTTILKYQAQIGHFQKERRKVFKRSDVDDFMKLNTIKRI